MTWALTLQTAPSEEPLTTAEAKSHLRVDFTDDDTLIDALVVAAREYGEGFTGRAFVTQTWDYFADRFPADNGAIYLPRPTLQSVTTLKYVDTDGTQQTLASSKYRVDINSEPGRVTPAYGEEWPSIRPVTNAVEVRFKAGYGDAGTDVPDQIKQAILFLVGHMYEHREAVITGTIVSKVPMATEYMLWPYRVWL